ncbi:MAG: CPBP family intramembrane glutamic endopeptidase [Candidatus Saccharimonas sp.]
MSKRVVALPTVPRKMGVWAVVVIYVAFMLIAAVLVVKYAALVLHAAMPTLTISAPTFQRVLTVCLLSLSVVLLAIAPFPWLKKQSWRINFGVVRVPSWRDIALSAAGAAVYAIVVLVVVYFASMLPFIDMKQPQDVGSTALYGFDRLLAFFVLVIVTPIAEEMIFRGYLFSRLQQAKMPFWLNAVVVSGLFGLAHGQWNVGIDVFCLSMVACYLRLLSGTIWPGVIVHMAKNMLAFYATFVLL